MMIPRISRQPKLLKEGGFETRPYKRHAHRVPHFWAAFRQYPIALPFQVQVAASVPKCPRRCSQPRRTKLGSAASAQMTKNHGQPLNSAM
jgi:hypothetical protein